MSEKNSYMLFAGSSHEELAQQLSQELNKPLGKISVSRFPDGEIGVKVMENVRGRDVFLFQTIALQPNDYLMELLIIIDALKRASAKSIVTVIPYYGYARQDRRDGGREPITAKLVANLLEKAGATQMMTMDLHTDQIQGFFDIPVDNLSARPLLVNAIKGLGLEDLAIVSPDIGSNKLAGRFAEDLGVDLAIVDKRRVSSEKVEAQALIGQVTGKNVVIVDDLCSTGGTLRLAAKVCKKAGAKRVFSAVTHALQTEKALEGSEIEKMFITNTIPIPTMPKCEAISSAKLLAQAIECVVAAKSISSLYDHENIL